jgi:hypothetical protein
LSEYEEITVCLEGVSGSTMLHRLLSIRELLETSNREESVLRE